MNARPAGPASTAVQRVDKWLWHARVVRTRSAAAALVAGGRVRVNRQRVDKPGYAVAVGDVLTVGVSGRVRVMRICSFAARRGSATEAAGLYEDITLLSPAGHSDDADA